MCVRRGNTAVRPFQILAPADPEHAGRLVRFAAPRFRRAVAAELSSREIAEADRQPGGGVPRDGARQANLDVVGVRSENQ